MPKKRDSRYSINKKKHKRNRKNDLKQKIRKLKKEHSDQKGGFFWMLPLLALLKWGQEQERAQEGYVTIVIQKTQEKVRRKKKVKIT